MAKNGTKEAILIALFLPPSLNSQVAITNNIPPVIEFEAPKHNRYSTKDSQQVPILYKASGKSKLKEGKKRSRLKLVIYGSRGDSKGKPIRYKKLDNSKTKSGRYNK